MSSRNTKKASHTMPHPHRLICHYWNKEHAPNCSFPNCRYKHVGSMCTFNAETTNIHRKAVHCPYHLNQTRAGHLLQGSHNLHLYFPKATDNTTHTSHNQYCYTTHPHTPTLTLYVSIITYCVSHIAIALAHVINIPH